MVFFGTTSDMLALIWLSTTGKASSAERQPRKTVFSVFTFPASLAS
jgi:hypothetical protein